MNEYVELFNIFFNENKNTTPPPEIDDDDEDECKHLDSWVVDDPFLVCTKCGITKFNPDSYEQNFIEQYSNRNIQIKNPLKLFANYELKLNLKQQQRIEFIYNRFTENKLLRSRNRKLILNLIVKLFTDAY